MRKLYGKYVIICVLMSISVLGACGKPSHDDVVANSEENSIVSENVIVDSQISKELSRDEKALASAMDWLDFSAYSYSELMEKLKEEGYTEEEAAKALDNCGADWNEQALRLIKLCTKSSAFSYSGLSRRLAFSGFTEEQIKYGIENSNIDWNEQAAKSAQDYLDYSTFTREELLKLLTEDEEFTAEQAEYGVSAVGY